jgi:hypothetical protein
MARQVYSSIIAAVTSVSSAVSVAEVPAGYTYVVRNVSMTYGSYSGFVRGYGQRNGVDPRLFTLATPTVSLLGVAHNTIEWQGRVVLEQGDQLWLGVESGDTCDFYVSGYTLVNT